MTSEKDEHRSAREAGRKGEGQGDFFFEQFRVPRGCLGYVVADSETGLAALVDPEVEMVEPMLDAVFDHALRPAYVIDTHTHADHVSGARELASKTVTNIVMHEKAPASPVGRLSYQHSNIY